MRDSINVEGVGLDVIAAHEAGHVLLAHYYGRKVYGAYLQTRPLSPRDRDERSHVRFALTPHIQEVHLDLGKLDQRWPLAVHETLVTTRIRLAGPMAQSIYQKIPYHNVKGGQDYQDAIYELMRLECLRLSLPEPHRLDISYKHEDILDTLADEIMTLLSSPIYVHFLDTIAQGLLERQEPNAVEITEILEAMPRYHCAD